ncbi:MAG: MEDS domain-containing protein [Candidatus Nitrosopolaris sp.]
MVKPVIEGNANYILQQIKDAVKYGEHNLLIYPNLHALTEIYSQYFKIRLDANKEIILFLSTYQSVNCVRRNLRGVDLDVAKCEEDGSLVIIDSVRGYFGSEVDVLCLVKILSKRAQNQSRSGCFVIADMGSFYLIRRINELTKYEASMPLKFDGYDDGLIMCKAFCAYHQQDFDRFTEDEKQLLFEHHYRNFIVIAN